MKLLWTLILSALAAFTAAATAAGVEGVIETIDYNGRLVAAGQPFSGKGNFKFALLQKNGTRLWTSGDNEPPIEEGVPSGSISLSVRDGIYRVRLGDPGLGMKTLPKALSATSQISQVGIWFDDGTHGWSSLGNFNLASGAGHAVPTTMADDPTANILAELRSLRAEVAELRRQLAEVKDRPVTAAPSTSSAPAAVKPVPMPVAVTLNEAKRHSLGKADAPVVLVEFTDYECGYCKRFFEQTFPLLKKNYIDTGKLRFVSRNMPVASHSQAEPAALALLGAAERADEDYWKMRTWLFGNQRDLGSAGLNRYADEVGLDRATLLAGIAAKKHGIEIQEDIAAAKSVGITGTPSFVLGTSDGQIIRGERIIGAKSFQMFESRIQALLAKAGSPMSVNEPKPR